MWTNEKPARDFELGREHAEIPPLPKEEKRGRTQPYDADERYILCKILYPCMHSISDLH